MINEFNRIWKGAIMTLGQVRHYLSICLEGLKKPMKNLSEDSWCPG
jgi:hypothetical protein